MSNLTLEKVLREVASTEIIELLFDRSVNDSKKMLRNAFSVDISANEHDPVQIRNQVRWWWQGADKIRDRLIREIK